MEQLILDTSSIVIYIPGGGLSITIIVFVFASVGLKIFQKYEARAAYRETIRRRLGL